MRKDARAPHPPAPAPHDSGAGKLFRGKDGGDAPTLPSPVHLIGIGGAGMSALAGLLLDCGCVVTGSDKKEQPPIAPLRQRGAQVGVPHDARHIGAAQLVVYSADVPAENVERRAAAACGIRAVKRAALLGELSALRQTIAVAGTHGKTTTTAMIAWILHQTGSSPGWAVGGDVPDLGGSARWGAGPWFVVEADEYDRSFLHLHPQVAIITNVGVDHLDYYRSPVALYQAFEAFAGRTPATGLLVAGEDAAVQMAARAAPGTVQTIGVTESSDWRASDVEANPDGTAFCISAPSGEHLRCTLLLPGQHNVRNALAAVAAAVWAGIPPVGAVAALASFRGAARRFQIVGRVAEVTVYEDYAVHPTEIRATLAAARQVYPSGHGRLWAVLEPHTFSRMESLFTGFTQAFGDADRVLITDVYSPPGRERPTVGKGSVELAAATDHPAVWYAGDQAAALQRLLIAVQPGDCVVVMGAGPIYQLAYDLVGHLCERA